jgi:conjugative transfer signal peptidase TraF
MKNRRMVGIVLLTYAGMLLSAKAFDVRPNFTDSAPIGLWIKKPIQSIKKGSIVAFCPPAPDVHSTPGDCPAPFIKPAAALPGDTVRLLNGYPATVNGAELPNTAAHPSMTAWPDGEYIVKAGEVWVFSSYNPKSFDSRYFGPIELSSIQGEAVPLLVYGDPAAMTKGQL